MGKKSTVAKIGEVRDNLLKQAEIVHLAGISDASAKVMFQAGADLEGVLRALRVTIPTNNGEVVDAIGWTDAMRRRAPGQHERLMDAWQRDNEGKGKQDEQTE